MSGDIYVGNLFSLFNEIDRSQDLVDYLEERWSGLDAFAADYPHGDFGYDLMTDVAYAYSVTGNQRRFDEAMAMVESAVTKLSGQGVDNFVTDLENARYFALAGRYDEAIAHLSKAVDSGMQGGNLLETDVVFSHLWDDPRFQALHSKMIVKTNEQRAILGLPAIEFETRL
jgi:tetratricopeptide (TPR) repeat protein